MIKEIRVTNNCRHSFWKRKIGLLDSIFFHNPVTLRTSSLKLARLHFISRKNDWWIMQNNMEEKIIMMGKRFLNWWFLRCVYFNGIEVKLLDYDSNFEKTNFFRYCAPDGGLRTRAPIFYINFHLLFFIFFAQLSLEASLRNSDCCFGIAFS